jgi:dihydroorotase
MTRLSLLTLAGIAVAGLAGGQTYDLVLRGGHVIDPANNIDAVADVAINGGRVARVAPSLPSGQARATIDVSGLYVTPGLIDMHTHVYLSGRANTVWPDDTALITGATTVVDAGVSGWRTFDDFKAAIIDKAKTRVLVMLNIVGGGMSDKRGAEDNVDDMDPAAAAAKVKQYPDVIVAIKTAHFSKPGFTAVRRAVEAGRLADRPVMIDSSVLTNSGRNTREKLLDILRPGDIHTHTYNDRQIELLDRFSGKVQPYAQEARRRGVLFDLGHGGGSFLWPVAARAMREGFPPDTISTDMHPPSIIDHQVDMPNCITKLMALGMELPDAIRRSTVNPAKALRHFPELGTLGEGRGADIAVFELRTGVFPLMDSWSVKRLATRKLECVMTLRDGKVVYDLNGLSLPLWNAALR